MSATEYQGAGAIETGELRQERIAGQRSPERQPGQQQEKQNDGDSAGPARHIQRYRRRQGPRRHFQ
jgi:hypothetical protein